MTFYNCNAKFWERWLYLFDSDSPGIWFRALSCTYDLAMTKYRLHPGLLSKWLSVLDFVSFSLSSSYLWYSILYMSAFGLWSKPNLHNYQKNLPGEWLSCVEEVEWWSSDWNWAIGNEMSDWALHRTVAFWYCSPESAQAWGSSRSRSAA